MQEHVPFALFVYMAKTTDLADRLRNYPSNPAIKAVLFDELMAYQPELLIGVDHVFVSEPLNAIK
jgi:hypothetical protein